MQHEKDPEESQDNHQVEKWCGIIAYPPHNGVIGGHCTRFSDEVIIRRWRYTTIVR